MKKYVSGPPNCSNDMNYMLTKASKYVLNWTPYWTIDVGTIME